MEAVEEDMFDSLQEFQMVLDELLGDKSMDKVRVEYEKLIHAVKESRDNEKRLMSKCRELKAEIISASSKVADTLKQSQDDERTITSLNKVHFHNRLKMIEALTKERDQLLTTVEDLREKLNTTIETQQEIETKCDATISQLQLEVQVHQNEIYRETTFKEKLEKEGKQLHMDMEAKMADIKALNLQVQKAKEEQQKLEEQLKELKILNERSTKELEQMHAKNTKLQQDCEQLSSAKQSLSLENQQYAYVLKMKEEEMTQMRLETAKQTKLAEVTQKKLRHIKDQKADVEEQRETLMAQIAALEKDLETSQKQVDTDKKVIDELIRERDILNKKCVCDPIRQNIIKCAQSTEKEQNLVKLLEQNKKILEHDLNGYRQGAHKQGKLIQQLEKERDRYINETNSLLQKVQQKMNDIDVREKEIFDWKKKVTETECKLKHQEHLLETVVSERNHLSKNLIEAQEEIAEMKRMMKTMNNQVQRLRDEITGNDLIVYTVCARPSLYLQVEVQMLKLQLEETKQQVESQKTEQHQLRKIIADADAEQIHLKMQLEQVFRERDNLGRQLLRRNDECALLHEKISIQQSLLNKGEFQYNQRVEDIRLLKLEIKTLLRKNSMLDRNLPNTEDLRRELFHLQRELVRERTRKGVLEEQLKPINIHRWRHLEGSDPGKYELIQRITSLQKKLIAKTQELEERELLLQEKDKLYVELKQTLARHPGPKAIEELQQCKWTLREKTKKIQVISSEVRMFHSKINEYQIENQTLANDMADIKTKYLRQKKFYR
uniref:Cilia- and flagella-associated protein 58 central coiled coil domain-containing protein n=1 Tax=Mola mola TaxID=94237 RepID=A0A3Q4AT91_MOLML